MNRPDHTSTEQERLKQVNLFIVAIGSGGRRFFYNKTHDRFARMKVSKSGHVWFLDDYTNKWIYTHYSGRWSGFSHGGTMRDIIEGLRNHIKRNTSMRAAYFNADWGSGFRNPWGYGDDLKTVKAAAIELGIADGSIPASDTNRGQP